MFSGNKQSFFAATDSQKVLVMWHGMGSIRCHMQYKRFFFLSVVNVRWHPKIGTTKMLGKDPQKIDGYLKSIEMSGVFWSEQAMKKTKNGFTTLL